MEQCMIHHPEAKEDDQQLISPKTYDSWLTLLEAAKVRNHTPTLEIAKEVEGQEIPKIFYHRKCRSLFTMKKCLDTLKRKADESINDEDDITDCTSKRPPRRANR